MNLDILFSHVGMIDYPRGAFYRSFSLAQELSKKGHNVVFLCTQQDEFIFPCQIENRSGVKVISFPSISPAKVRQFGYAILPILFKIFYVLIRKYDVYHCDHHRPAGFLCALVGRFFYGGKVFVEWMDYMGKGSQYDHKSLIWKATIGPLDNYLEIKSKTMADGVIVVSEYLKKRSLKAGVSEENIIKLWGASDTESIDFLKSKATSRKKYELPINNFIVNLANMSNTEIEDYYSYLLEFFTKLHENRKITIIKTGHKSERLKKLAKKLDINICQYGSVSYQKYCTLLSVSDCYLLFQEENLREISRWPNVIGDFIAAGNPTLLRPVGDARICVEKYPYAFICVDSLEAMNQKVDELYVKTDFMNRKRIRCLAENGFSWNQRCDDLLNFYFKSLN